MTPRELKIWRLDHKMTLITMARVLGVSRNTAWNYENGVTPLPVDLVERLNAAAFDTARRPVASAPTVLTVETATLRPHLKLYVRRGAKWQVDKEHPTALGIWREPIHVPIPFDILDSQEYLDALARHHGEMLENAERAKRLNIEHEGRYAQARIDRGLEQPGDAGKVAAAHALLTPPAEWPYEARIWRNMIKEARYKWCRDNGVPFTD